METENGGDAAQFLTFALDEELYAVAVAQVEVVLEMQPVTRVPNARDHMRGVINYRGSVIPVVDLRVRFGLSPSPLTGASSIIVLQLSYEGDYVTVGMLADGVREVVSLEAGKLEKAPAFGSKIDERIISGIARLNDGFVVVLDINAAFESVEDSMAAVEMA